MDRLIQDIRHGGRALMRDRAFSLTALLTLALGIGATTAIFTVVNAVLLTPPPYPAPDRLYVLSNPPDIGSQTGQMFHYIRDRASAFENVASNGGALGWNLVKGNHAEYVTGMPVSRGYFDVVGVRPLIGRSFNVAEDQPRGPRVVILSHALWRRLFSGSSEAIGQSIQLGGVTHTIVGIMPATFQPLSAAELWTPLQVSPRDNGQNYTVIGRLRADATESEAANELDALRRLIPREVRSVSEMRARTLQWISYQEWLGQSQRHDLLLLFGAVLFLLVIACANVASLQLSRAVGRRREMATRTALGATAPRLVQQVLTESVLLAMGGAGLGLLAAQWGVQSLLAFVPEDLLGNRTVAIDWRVLGFVLIMSASTGIIFGLAPAFGGTKFDLRAALADSGRHTAGRPTLRLRGLFAVAQVALAVVLLVGAGLLIRTLVNLRGVELGFDPSNVVVGKMSLQGSNIPDLATFFDRTLSNLRATRGISAAAVANNVPVERGLNLAIEPPSGGLLAERRSVDWRYVSAGYFDVFGIPLREGRVFERRDTATSAPIAVVNEAFALTFFGRQRVVGEYIDMYGTDPPRQIVGMVANVKARSGAGWTRGLTAMAAPAPPVVYVPVAQISAGALQEVHRYFPMSWAVRTNGEPGNASRDVQRVVQTAAPQLVFWQFNTMEEIIGRDLEHQRFLTTLVTLFAAAAMLLAAVGVYGLATYSVSQRTKEMGIRIAFGATSGDVLRTVITEGVSLAAFGIAAGLVAAVLVSRVLASLVFNIAPHDGVTLLAVSVVLLGVMTIATLVPAVQAARTNPVQAIRTE